VKHELPQGRRVNLFLRRKVMFRKVNLILTLAVFAVIVVICAAPKRTQPVHAQKSVPPADGACCGKKPPKLPDLPANGATAAQIYSTFSGQIAVVTGQLRGGSSMLVMDLKNENSGLPINTNWTGPSYSHYDWATTKYGDWFGLTLDNQGNIYTTATTSYFLKSPVTAANPGRVFRIDGTTGLVNVFATLPNQTPAVGSAPALGNIFYDCRHDSFYVSNFADGRIYQIKRPSSSATTGTVVATFDHQTGTIDTSVTAGGPEGGVTYSTFSLKNPPGTARGGRVWGLATHGASIFYAVWRQDSGDQTGPANEVWSVPLASNGNFQGTPTLEFALPALHFSNPTNGSAFSNPVASITFNAAGDMLLAERSMNGDSNNKNGSFAAHASRYLEYTWNGSAWVLMLPAKFGPGTLTSSGSPSSAGGAAYDPLGARVWGTADAMHLIGNPPGSTDVLYGIQGLPMSGGSVLNSLLVDLTDTPTTTAHKNQMGDVEIPCAACDGVPTPTPTPPATCDVKTNEISCKRDGTGGYLYTFTVTNNTGKPVTKVLVTPPPNSNFSITPQNPPLPGGVLPDGQSATLTVTIMGGQPGKQVCFTVTLMTKDGPCCTVEVCPVLPDCCAVATNVKVECGRNGSYTYVLSIVNTSPNTIQHIYLYPPAGVTMTPSYFAVSLAPGATFQTPPITITGARPGSFCFSLSLHTEGMKECCSGDQCVTLPECPVYPPR
jgi:hypothetical protein